jgi:hypothetical protein
MIPYLFHKQKDMIALTLSLFHEPRMAVQKKRNASLNAGQMMVRFVIYTYQVNGEKKRHDT